MNKEIKDLIEQYAKVYNAFESFQNGDKPILPGGDQKTGVIAEYYAMCYIKKTFDKNAEYAKPGESFDLKYQSEGKEIKVQIKAVSAYSKTRIIAPLNLVRKEGKPPFDFLLLISLDKNFKPEGFYINSYEYIKKSLDDKGDSRTKIQGAVMKGENKSGFWLFDFNKDEKDKLIEAINI
jgi:hypothetical protein